MELPFNAQVSAKSPVIAFDYDDTLFSTSLGYNQAAFRAISALVQQGRKVCIVTNRGKNADDEMFKMQLEMGFIAAGVSPVALEAFAKSAVKTDEFPYKIIAMIDNEDPHDPETGYLPEDGNPVVIRVGKDFSLTSDDAFLATVMTGLDVVQTPCSEWVELSGHEPACF